MKNSFNFFSSTTGIVVTGLLLGLIAVFLQFSGNPGNMGICVVCFNRDIAGAVGLHRAPIVQYLRPEIMGMVLGSLAAALCFGEYRARGGSAPAVRFLLGVIAAIGALVFLGCPWRVIMRLAGGDANALFGLAGLVVGIGLGTVFFRMGFSLGRSQSQSKASGLILPGIMLALVAVYLFNPPVAGQAQSGVLFYSLKGPGSMHAPFLLSLGAGLLVGFLAQRSRFCTMGAVRDVLLFNQWHLALGFLAMLAAALVANLAIGGFHPGFEGQPVAHTDGLWNFLGMVTAGLAFALAGGCPGRQLFMPVKATTTRPCSRSASSWARPAPITSAWRPARRASAPTACWGPWAAWPSACSSVSSIASEVRNGDPDRHLRALLPPARPDVPDRCQKAARRPLFRAGGQ